MTLPGETAQKLWILGHPFDWRRWLRFNVLDSSTGRWSPGLVLAEWPDGADLNGVAALPAQAPGNIDPLVVGKGMYWDYCKRKRNFSTNEFQPGDTIFFASYRGRLGGLLIDTIFVVGEARPWPSDTKAIPDWPDLDPCALRVHFQDRAHRTQHREVHKQVKGHPAFSYRGRSFGEDKDLFSWVPYAAGEKAVPFVVRAGTRPHALLSEIYPGSFLDKIKGQFSIAEVTPRRAGELHDALRKEAAEQRFRIGVRVELLSSAQTRGASKGRCH